MQQRGRKSAESIGLQVIHFPGQLPEPPACLTESQSVLWRRIVATKPADWFGHDTYPLLIEYVRAIEAADLVARQLDEFDPEWLKDVDGLKRYETLSRIQNSKGDLLARLATKMRLSQQSRYGARAAESAARKAGAAKRPWEQ